MILISLLNNFFFPKIDMKTIDFTKLLPYEKYHCFNPSIVHIRDTFYLLSFRHILKTSEKYDHPWSLWNGNYRSKLNHPSKYSSFGSSTMDGYLDMEIVTEKCPLQEQCFLHMGTFDDMFRSRNDGTTFILLTDRNGTLEIVHVFPNPQHMIDVRLSKDENDCIWLVYDFNRWIGFPTDPKWVDIMRYRCISFQNDYQTLILHNEMNLLEHMQHKPNEKNCQLHFPNRILYHISPSFHSLNLDGTGNCLTENKVYQYILKQEGDYVHMSLGSPPIPYTSTTNICVGHFKVIVLELLKQNRQTPLRYLYDTIINSHPHKYLYIYFMYLFEYNRTSMEIVSISPAFLVLPKEHDNIPYPVVFPMSILHKNQYFKIFYGDGDTMCKILSFHEKEIDAMLFNPSSFHDYYPFIILQANDALETLRLNSISK